MREIKFRSWFDRDKVMDYNVGYHPTILEFHHEHEKDNGQLTICPMANGYHLMQFTGLQDKDGREIFEGDIVETPVYCGKSVVEFDKGLFGLNHDYGTDNKTMLGAWGSECNLRSLYDGYHREIKVIGNIYENPELLNPFKPCGEGENICNCKNESECGYK